MFYPFFLGMYQLLGRLTEREKKKVLISLLFQVESGRCDTAFHMVCLCCISIVVGMFFKFKFKTH